MKERKTDSPTLLRINDRLNKLVERALRQLNNERALRLGDHTRVPHSIRSTGTSTKITFGD